MWFVYINTLFWPFIGVYYKTRNTGTRHTGTLVEHRNTGVTYNRILAEQSEYHGIVEQRNNKTTPRNTTNTERRHIEQKK